jgi:hypothetical protein
MGQGIGSNLIKELKKAKINSLNDLEIKEKYSSL